MNKQKEELLTQLSIYGVPVLALLLIVLILLFGIAPSISRILEARSNLTKEENRLRALEEKSSQLSQLDESKIRLNVEKMMNILPAYKSIPGLLTGLERMAAEASASVEAFSISPGKISTTSAGATEAATTTVSVSLSRVPSVDFGITLRGNFSSLRAFLTKLSSSARVLGVKSISFTSTEMKTGADSVSSNILLRAYYLPYPANLGSIDEPVKKLTAEEEKILERVLGYEIYSIPPSYGQSGKSNPFLKF